MILVSIIFLAILSIPVFVAYFVLLQDMGL